MAHRCGRAPDNPKQKRPLQRRIQSIQCCNPSLSALLLGIPIPKIKPKRLEAASFATEKSDRLNKRAYDVSMVCCRNPGKYAVWASGEDELKQNLEALFRTRPLPEAERQVFGFKSRIFGKTLPAKPAKL